MITHAEAVNVARVYGRAVGHDARAAEIADRLLTQYVQQFEGTLLAAIMAELGREVRIGSDMLRISQTKNESGKR